MKRFLLRLGLLALPFLLLGLYYGWLCVTQTRSGDLGPLGHLFFEKGYHDKLSDTTCLNYVADVSVSSLNDTTYDILTIGDSFSGADSKFQRYAGAQLHQCVYNLRYNRHLNPADVALSLLLYLPTERLPHTIIIENAERNSHWMLRDLRLNDPITWDSVCRSRAPKGETTSLNWGCKAIEYYQRRLGIKNKVLVEHLDRDLFTCQGKSRRLYCYMEDTIHHSPADVETSLRNLDSLHQIAQRRGVRLLYFVAPNKSTVYRQHYSAGNRYYAWTLSHTPFDTLAYYICPVRQFQQMVGQNVCDLYYADDSHWSPVGARVAGELLAEQIKAGRQ